MEENAAECKTLWMGDIQMTWDESFIRSLFAEAGEIPTVKLIRDRVTGYPAGYGFLEFSTRYGAERALEIFNGQVISNTMHRFRLNWGAGGKRMELPDEHSIFVGDLAPDVGDALLLSTFSVRFPSVRGAKVVIDQMTGMSKGFGFVRFGSKEEAEQALETMTGVYISSRQVRVSAATDRKSRGQIGLTPTALASEGHDPGNTTVFVGGLDPAINEEELKSRFSALGEVVYVKIPPGRGCGFVQFVEKESAEKAIASMNGSQIGNSKVRCAWGRSNPTKCTTMSTNGTAPQCGGYYSQQYQQGGYDQYQAAGYYQQQGGGYGGPYAGYGQQYQQPMGYGYQDMYPMYQQHPQMSSGGYSHGHDQVLLDFTKPEDVNAANQAYAYQHAQQFVPPLPMQGYPMSNDSSAAVASSS